MRGTNRRGFALLEAVVSLAILATCVSGIAWLGREYTAQWADVVRQHREYEAAENLITAVTLWPVEDLDRHLGWSEQGRWRLVITRVRPSLYDIVLVEPPERVLLRTAVFREAVTP
jgi:hypothetical protein